MLASYHWYILVKLLACILSTAKVIWRFIYHSTILCDNRNFTREMATNSCNKLRWWRFPYYSLPGFCVHNNYYDHIFKDFVSKHFGSIGVLYVFVLNTGPKWSYGYY